MICVQVVVLSLGWLRAEQRDFVLALSHEDRYRVMLGRASAKPVTNNRNQVVKRFLLSPSSPEFLLMMDNDVVPKCNPLDYIEHDLDIVVFPCPLWKPSQGAASPVVWNIRMRDEDGCLLSGSFKTGGLREISEGGTGAILIARRVLEHPAMRSPFVEQMDEYGVSTLGHDLAFCVRARSAGFRLWAATDCACSHWEELDLQQVDSILRNKQ